MIKRLFVTILLFSLLLTTFVQAADVFPNVAFSQVELKRDDTYTRGFQRLSYVIKKNKGIESSVIDISKVDIINQPNVNSKYKITLKSNKNWVNGDWILDIVPYTKENMSIKTARTINPKYDWWYVYYNNQGKPEAVVWARKGK